MTTKEEHETRKWVQEGVNAESLSGNGREEDEMTSDSTLMIDYWPTDRIPPIAITRRRHGKERTPPGGGACWWCNAKLYQRRRQEWIYAVFMEDGHERSVHVRQCNGSDASDRPKNVVVDDGPD